MHLRPELLLHPTIPAPLHGIAPRNILGKKWWDATRAEAYKKYDDCCWSCGTHKSKTWYRKYLEAHESYNIDYVNCLVTLNEVVGLCHSCHNYIHIGRMVKQHEDKIIGDNYLRNVLDWGMTVLTKAGHKPQATQAYHWLMAVKGWSAERAMLYVLDTGLEMPKFDPNSWDRWEIEIEGKRYQGKSEMEWLKEYGNVSI